MIKLVIIIVKYATASKVAEMAYLWKHDAHNAGKFADIGGEGSIID